MKKAILLTFVALSGLGFYAQSEAKADETVSAKFGNSVSGAAQAKGYNFVYFEGDKSSGGLLCFGHSLTKHGPVASLGWSNDCGMAASGKDKDYVHLLWSMLKKKYNDPKMGLCIAQGAYFERNFPEADKILPAKYQAARDFKPKWIVISIADNTNAQMLKEHDFIKEYDKLVKFLNPDGKAKMIITTGWYPSDKINPQLKAYAAKKGITIVDIAEISKKPGMKAIGLYKHPGVASHPSDAGMAALADAYFKALTSKK
ncbi:MAG: SGNH/GDSL hydrolase family protein, partial [Christensenellales bacterium]